MYNLFLIHRHSNAIIIEYFNSVNIFNKLFFKEVFKLKRILQKNYISNNELNSYCESRQIHIKIYKRLKWYNELKKLYKCFPLYFKMEIYSTDISLLNKLKIFLNGLLIKILIYFF